MWEPQRKGMCRGSLQSARRTCVRLFPRGRLAVARARARAALMDAAGPSVLPQEAAGSRSSDTRESRQHERRIGAKELQNLFSDADVNRPSHPVEAGTHCEEEPSQHGPRRSSRATSARHNPRLEAMRSSISKQAIGRRLSILWTGCTPPTWFTGEVRDFSSPLHLIKYDDGETKWHDLAAELALGQLQWEGPLPSAASGATATASSSARVATKSRKKMHAARPSAGGVAPPFTADDPLSFNSAEPGLQPSALDASEAAAVEAVIAAETAEAAALAAEAAAAAAEAAYEPEAAEIAAEAAASQASAAVAAAAAAAAAGSMHDDTYGAHATVGERLFARDRVGIWSAARVVALRSIPGAPPGDANAEVRVHFQGWSARHDEWIAVGTGRLRLERAEPHAASHPEARFAAGQPAEPLATGESAEAEPTEEAEEADVLSEEAEVLSAPDDAMDYDLEELAQAVQVAAATTVDGDEGGDGDELVRLSPSCVNLVPPNEDTDDVTDEPSHVLEVAFRGRPVGRPPNGKVCDPSLQRYVPPAPARAPAPAPAPAREPVFEERDREWKRLKKVASQASTVRSGRMSQPVERFDPNAHDARVAALKMERVRERMEKMLDVEKICDERQRLVGQYMQTEFRIRWKGFGPDSDTWEPQRHIVNGAAVIAKFRDEKRAVAVALAGSEAAFAAQMVRVAPPLLVQVGTVDAEAPAPLPVSTEAPASLQLLSGALTNFVANINSMPLHPAAESRAAAELPTAGMQHFNFGHSFAFSPAGLPPASASGAPASRSPAAKADQQQQLHAPRAPEGEGAPETAAASDECSRDEACDAPAGPLERISTETAPGGRIAPPRLSPQEAGIAGGAAFAEMRPYWQDDQLVEGVRLMRSVNSDTGYKGVYRSGSSSRFVARGVEGRPKELQALPLLTHITTESRFLGTFPSAQEAAVAVAKHAISLETYLEWIWERHEAAEKERQAELERKRRAEAAQAEERREAKRQRLEAKRHKCEARALAKQARAEERALARQMRLAAKAEAKARKREERLQRLVEAGVDTSWAAIEVGRKDIVQEHPKYRDLQGDDVCVLAAAYSADGYRLTQRGMIGWRGEVGAVRGGSRHAEIEVFGRWFDLSDDSLILPLEQEDEWEDEEEEDGEEDGEEDVEENAEEDEGGEEDLKEGEAGVNSMGAEGRLSPETMHEQRTSEKPAGSGADKHEETAPTPILAMPARSEALQAAPVVAPELVTEDDDPLSDPLPAEALASCVLTVPRLEPDQDGRISFFVEHHGARVRITLGEGVTSGTQMNVKLPSHAVADVVAFRRSALEMYLASIQSATHLDRHPHLVQFEAALAAYHDALKSYERTVVVCRKFEGGHAPPAQLAEAHRTLISEHANVVNAHTVAQEDHSDRLRRHRMLCIGHSLAAHKHRLRNEEYTARLHAAQQIMNEALTRWSQARLPPCPCCVAMQHNVVAVSASALGADDAPIMLGADDDRLAVGSQPAQPVLDDPAQVGTDEPAGGDAEQQSEEEEQNERDDDDEAREDPPPASTAEPERDSGADVGSPGAPAGQHAGPDVSAPRQKSRRPAGR